MPTSPADPVRDEPPHRAYVGPGGSYDLGGAMQFALLTLFGLREHHRVLDVGCGSLRAGRLLIPYLLPDRYFAIEPNRWLVSAAIGREINRAVIEERRPTITHDEDMTFPHCPAGFDFVLAASIFTHAPRRLVTRCLQQAARHLTPGGVLLASYLPGGEDYEGHEWHYEPRVCVTYRTTTMIGLAREAGLEVLRVEAAPRFDQEWLAFVPPERPAVQLPRFRLLRRSA